MDAQSAIEVVRAARPGAIETREPELHVRSRRHIIDNPRKPSMSDDPTTDCALGSLLGLAVGDAIGTTLARRAPAADGHGRRWPVPSRAGRVDGRHVDGALSRREPS
jgi:hypothetical protein